MSAERDVTRVVRSWLHEDAHEDAERVLSLVLEELETTPQRRALWPAWRSPLMNSNSVRIALAAAAVLVVALIGIQLVGGTGFGGPGASPSPTESPSPVPTATPVPSAAAFPPSGPLAIGRHKMTLAGVPLSMELPTTGWVSNGDFGIDKGDMRTVDAAGFILWRASAADNVFSDPCSETPMSPPAGRSPAELAAAVAAIPGTELVSAPAAVRVGGYRAQKVVIKIPEKIDCAPEQFYLWYDADDPSGELGRYASQVNSTIAVWIIDVEGTIVWIDGETYASSGPQAAEEVQQIVDSIQFAHVQGPG